MNHRDRSGHRGKRIFSLRSLCPLWLIILLFSACIPAETPPNLNATPAPGVVITRSTYQSDAFSLEYPTGWRVITSPAGAPPSVILVAPGDCALIQVSSAPLDAPPDSPSCQEADIRTVARTVTLGDATIALAGSAPADGWDGFLSEVDRVAASLKGGA